MVRATSILWLGPSVIMLSLVMSAFVFLLLRGKVGSDALLATIVFGVEAAFILLVLSTAP